ncbi:MAG: hypothetical protein J3K34DRAFT_417874 [Monoraphidium minutum]|nr:MAG: hypothetical protein J3K34DRAFT_417874 [Monoraphidium minutum]
MAGRGAWPWPWPIVSLCSSGVALGWAARAAREGGGGGPSAAAERAKGGRGRKKAHSLGQEVYGSLPGQKSAKRKGVWHRQYNLGGGARPRRRPQRRL